MSWFAASAGWASITRTGLRNAKMLKGPERTERARQSGQSGCRANAVTALKESSPNKFGKFPVVAVLWIVSGWSGTRKLFSRADRPAAGLSVESSYAARHRHYNWLHEIDGKRVKRGGGREMMRPSEVRAGEVFMGCTEKTEFPNFGFSRRGPARPWRSQETAPGKNLHLGVKSWRLGVK
jgi:hypothetical protein